MALSLWRREELRSAAYALLLLGAVALGCWYRVAQMRAAPDFSLPLSSDAQSYYDEALLLQQRVAGGASPIALFFSGSTWFREPLFVFLLQGWLSLFGTGEVQAVYFSIAASLVWLLSSGVAAGALLGRAVGVATAYLLAADAVWIRNAVLGLREEVAGSLLVLSVAALWLRPRRGLAAALASLAAACVALATLTRLDALPFGLFALVWAAVAQRWSATRIAIVVVVAAAILLPVFSGYARSRGDAFPSSSVIATANWREEFEDRMGTPGFEWERRVTPFEYLFVYHSLPQLTWYTARGVTRIYLQEMFDSLYYAIAGGSARMFGGVGKYLGLEWRYLTPSIFLLGVAGLLWQRTRWRTHWLPVALCLVGVLPPIGFIAGVPQHRLYQARYAYMAAPFASCVLAWALCTAARFTLRRLQYVAPLRYRRVPPMEAAA